MVNVPAVLVLPVTVVATTPPLIVTVALGTAALVEFKTLTVIFPAVAMGMLSVAVAPAVTATDNVRERYPVLPAVIFCVPAVILASVYVPVELDVADPPLQLTVAPETAAPLDALVIFPVTVPPPLAAVKVKLAVLLAPPVIVTL